LKKHLLIGLLLLNFIALIITALQPLDQLDGAFFPDDIFLVLELSRNIAEGFGPIYGQNYTNGFQPLVVFISAIFYLFTSDPELPVYLNVTLLSLFNTAALFILLKIVYKRYRSNSIATFAALMWIFNPLIYTNSMSGLETAIAIFFVLLVLYYIYSNNYLDFEHSYLKDFVLGLIFGAALLARIDSGFLMGSLLIFMIMFLFQGKVKFIRLLNSGLLILAGTFLIYSLWIIYSYYYTGMIYPISGKAVILQSEHILNKEAGAIFQYFPVMKITASKIIRYNFAMIAVSLLLFALYLILKVKIKLHFKREMYYIFLFMVLLTLSYIFHAHVYWFIHRYIMPVGLFFIFLNLELFDNIKHKLNPLYKKGIIALSALMVLTHLVNTRMIEEVYLLDENIGYGQAGKWANENLPEGTILGANQSGGIGYFATKHKVVNLDGVVNQYAYYALRDKKIMEYIDTTGIEYLLLWDSDYNYLIQRSSGENILELEYKIEEFETLWRKWGLYKVKR
jgi:hypothetical protein